MADFGKIFDGFGPRVYSIEPYENFLQILARDLSHAILENQFSSDAIIFLPTRRAARQLAQEFLDARKEIATILPRIRTLGDIDPEEINLSGLGGYLEFEPHISAQRKVFELAKLVQKRNEIADWSHDANNAINGAFALADLLDSAELMANGESGPDWSKLDDLVEGELADHWKQSREFLKIITHYWPQRLKELGLCDPANKRRRSIEILAKSWEESPPDFPVIIAGSTGSVPAARELMRVVASLPKGCVILPGLDKNMPDNEWQKLKEENGHPQRILFDTINHIGINRKDVKNLYSQCASNENLTFRRRVLNLALSPKEATASWINETKQIGKEGAKKALHQLTLIEAQTEEEEASAIALHMRQMLEEDKSCALISPNQNIAQRVCEKLQKWDINIDLSSGIPFNKSDLGIFVELVCEFILNPTDPKTIMALLAHPFAKFGMNFVDKKHGMIGIELALLRGAARDKSLLALQNRAQNLRDKDWQYRRAGKEKTLKLIDAIIKKFDEINSIAPQIKTIGEIAKFVSRAMEIIACDENQKYEYIWGKEAGKTGSAFFGQIIIDGQDFEVKSLNEGFKIIKNLISKNVVRPIGTHPNLAILGPLEARLLHFDKYILAGLDEGIWPQAAPIDPFLSRPMRETLGLQSKDLRLGLAAHDFSQLAAKENVVLTRAARRAGAPSVPSRWLWRLKTLIAGASGIDAQELTIHNCDFDALEILKATTPEIDVDIVSIIPKPKPPEFSRPKTYSATQIEALIRDPYKIYVNKVLGLMPLDPLGGEISAKERGSAIHKALEIIKDWEKVPENAFEILMGEFKTQLLAFGYDENMLGIELERLKPSAQTMVDFQKSREDSQFKIHVEQYIETQLETKSAVFNLKATADRIDIDKNGNAQIWDYKTGSIATDAQISSLLSPQLPVTAWILENQNEFEIKNVSAFGHIKIGNKNPYEQKYEGKQKDKKLPPLSMDEIIEKTDNNLKNLLEKFNQDNQIYLSKPRVEFLYPNQTWEDLTDRLARRIEWADAANGGDDE